MYRLLIMPCDHVTSVLVRFSVESVVITLYYSSINKSNFVSITYLPVAVILCTNKQHRHEEQYLP